MKIDFYTMNEAHLANFQGGELCFDAKIFNDGVNKILQGRLQPGASIGLHTHQTSSEIMFFTAGCGTMVYDGETIEVKAGDCHYCVKGHSHTLKNTGSEDLVFNAVVPEQ